MSFSAVTLDPNLRLQCNSISCNKTRLKQQFSTVNYSISANRGVVD